MLDLYVLKMFKVFGFCKIPLIWSGVMKTRPQLALSSRLYSQQYRFRTNVFSNFASTKPTALYSINQRFTGPKPLLQQKTAPLNNFTSVRTKIKVGRTTGKAYSVHAVLRRFFRLHNGMWIRTIAGRTKRQYKKSRKRNALSKRHVFCTAAQCKMLDKMVEPNMKKPKYYVNDPYEAYHKKTNLVQYRAPPRLFYP